ncbi:MAG: hypothetical protein ACR2FQ_07690 [Pseudonocardiaceae bacterium]
MAAARGHRRAATAHTHGARLYTRNPGDLRGLEGVLDVVTI